MDRQSNNGTALYCRLSRDDDNIGDSNSIQHQKQILERYAKDHGIGHYKFYVDDGYSGTNFNRPGFQEMLADIEAGHIRTIIVKDMSRFGRNYLEVGMYTEIMFPEKDIRFIAINDGVDSDREDSDFTPFRNIINEWYAKDTSKKIRAVFRSKAMSGKRIGSKIPYGYLKGEDGELVKDEETAPVVQLIFQLCAEGNGPGKIARILRERKINSPSTMKFLRSGDTQFYDPDNPFGWCATTIGAMLGNKEYLGHTVNYKTSKKSFKSKRVVRTTEEQQMIFENTHEPLVDKEMWDVVQNIRKQRHRPSKSGIDPLFSGLLVCADCGGGFASYQIMDNGVPNKKYTCSKYRNLRGIYKCTAHYVREDVLETLVLENLQKVITYVRDYEDEFVQQVMDNTLAQQKKQQAVAKRQLEQQTRRISEIDKIIQRLYEDNVSGKLSDERFAKMSATYEKEQSDLEASTTGLRTQIETGEQQGVNVKRFLKLVKSYTEPQKLTPEILHMFIEKIVVHDPDWSSGHRIQQIDIHYNFVGQLDMSVEMTRTRRRNKKEKESKLLAYQQAI